jgi:hypothetical protein
MSGEGHPADCPDCTTCQECEWEAAWCLSEHPINRPCPHIQPICSDCWPGTCADCIRDAERDLSYARCMAEPWTPHDLDDTTTPTEARAAQAADAAAWASAQAEVARTYGEAGRTYATWLQTRNPA